jgi:hypothetical protein
MLSRAAVGLSFLLSTAALVTPVAAEEPRDLWVAVGYGGRRMVSTDGLNWKITAEWAQPGGDDSNNLMSAVFAQGKFVVTGGGGGGNTAAGHVIVSDDGRTWRETWKAPGRVNPVLFGDGRFVAGGPDQKLYWSTDAETWTAGAKLEDEVKTHFRHGAFGNGVFVFVGNHGGGGGPSWCAVSPDGEKISHLRNDMPGHGQLVFGAGRFLMLSSHDKADLWSSTDGVKWTRVELDGDPKFSWLVWTGRTFLAGDWQQSHESPDGKTWQKRESAAKAHVMWSDGTRIISTGWPGKMFFSPDGKVWENSPALTENGINAVVRWGE